MNTIKSQFPIFENNPDLIYLDNSASAQKPKQVIDALTDYYSKYYSNINRGTYDLSIKSSQLVDDSRKSIQEFINAKYAEEIIFTRGTTDSINKLSLLLFFNGIIKENDYIYITEFEHHSNILPWQNIVKMTGAKIQKIPLNEFGEIQLDKFEEMIKKTGAKIVSFTGLSNVIGTIQDIKSVIEISKKYNALTAVDVAQLICHSKIDVQALDCDFISFSMHKLYGPTGVGVLYGKKELLERYSPVDFGGDMIKSATFSSCELAELPEKFEAGTINIADIIASKSAIDFVSNFGYENIQKIENELIKYSFEKISDLEKSIGKIQIIGYGKEHPEKRSGLISFVLTGISSFDIGNLLGNDKICVRTGFHCAEPLHQSICEGKPSIRISFGLYNDKEDIDKFFASLQKNIQRLI